MISGLFVGGRLSWLLERLIGLRSGKGSGGGWIVAP